MLFSNEYLSFCKAMAGPMAQILIWRRNGNRPCLDNLKLKEWFELSAGSLSLKEEYWDLSTRVQNFSERCGSESAEKGVLEEAEAEFCKKGRRRKVREGQVRFVVFCTFFMECVRIYQKVLRALCRKEAEGPGLFRCGKRDGTSSRESESARVIAQFSSIHVRGLYRWSAGRTDGASIRGITTNRCCNECCKHR